MSGHDPAEYGDELASDYDSLYPAEGLQTAATVDFLADLAARHAPPSVLEFGVGTGRLAIELQRRGITVAGIDASERMLAALRRKAPEALIDLVLGDFVSAQVEGHFSVVALVFNAVLDERGLDAQLAVFQNAARHLVVGGSFVVEALVLPDDDRDGEWRVIPRYVGEEHVELQLVRFDEPTGEVERTLVHLRPGGARFVSVRDSYTAPTELDVIARLSGFRRAARYSSWLRDPFTSRSRRHITVYEKVDEAAAPARVVRDRPTGQTP